MTEHSHDDLYVLIARLETRIDDLETRLWRAEDTLRDVGYRVDEAKRAADDAARSAQRGW